MFYFEKSAESEACGEMFLKNLKKYVSKLTPCNVTPQYILRSETSPMLVD
jgi:hypothetical protein